MAKSKKAVKAKPAKRPVKQAKKSAPRKAAAPKPRKAPAKAKVAASRSAKPTAKRASATSPKKSSARSTKVKPAAKLRVKAAPAPKKLPIAKGRTASGTAVGSKIAVKSSPTERFAPALVTTRATKTTTKTVMPTNSKENTKEVQPGGGIVQPATRTAPAMRLRADDAEILATAKERYGRKDLDMFRKLIQEQQQETREEFDILSQNILDTSGEFEADNQTYSLHTAEQGTDAIEREKTFLHAQRTSDYIKKLDEALERIDRGTYGICVVCGNLIEKQRLQAVPITQKHVDCKNRTQVRKPTGNGGFRDMEEPMPSAD